MMIVSEDTWADEDSETTKPVWDDELLRIIRSGSSVPIIVYSGWNCVPIPIETMYT